MKKAIVILSLFAFVIGCDSKTTPEKKTTPEVVKEDPDVATGLDLVAKSDCFTCHKVMEKVTGPAYKEVAAKYPNNGESIDYLSQKIIKGGSGVWGTVAMLPHPDIPEADAKLMAKYILSLK